MIVSLSEVSVKKNCERMGLISITMCCYIIIVVVKYLKGMNHFQYPPKRSTCVLLSIHDPTCVYTVGGGIDVRIV